jgi:hypothetical protein
MSLAHDRNVDFKERAWSPIECPPSCETDIAFSKPIMIEPNSCELEV